MEKERKILIVVLTLVIVWSIVVVSAVTFSLPDDKVISQGDSVLVINDEFALDKTNKIIYFIPLNTIAKNIVNEDETNVPFKFLDSDGQEIDENSKLKTGDELLIEFSDVSEKYTISVLSDLYGEGKASKIGAKLIATQIINRDDILTTVQFYASDIDGNGTLKMNDVMRMVKDLLVDNDESNVRVDFIGNGSVVSKKTDVCSKLDGDSCEITLPTITRDGWEILGFSSKRNSQVAEYTGDTITVSESMILYAITKQEFDIEFDKNGSDTLVENLEPIHCTLYNSQTDYNILMPEIVKNNGTVIGWSINSGATETDILAGSNIKVNKATKYYAITKRENTLSFDKNNADRLGSYNNYSCTSYNGNNCKVMVTLPKVYHTGYVILGYNTSPTATGPKTEAYVPGNTLEISLNNLNTTLYAITEIFSNDLTFTSQADIGGYSIDLEENVDYIEALNEISSIDFLFSNGKIFIVSQDSFDNILDVEEYFEEKNGIYSTFPIPSGEDLYLSDYVMVMATFWGRYFKARTGIDLLEDPEFLSVYSYFIEIHQLDIDPELAAELNLEIAEFTFDKEDFFAESVVAYLRDAGYSFLEDYEAVFIDDLSSEYKVRMDNYIAKIIGIARNNYEITE